MRSWRWRNHSPKTWILSICILAVAYFFGGPLVVLIRFFLRQPSPVVPHSCGARTEGHQFYSPTLIELCHGQGQGSACVITLQFTVRSAKDLDAEGDDDSEGKGDLRGACRVYAMVDHKEEASSEALPEQSKVTHPDISGGGKDPVWDFSFTLSVDARGSEQALLAFSFLCEDTDADDSDHRKSRIGQAEVHVADLLGGKGYSRSSTSREIMAAAQVFNGAGEPHGLLFYSYTATIQQHDTELQAGLDAIQADQLPVRTRGGVAGIIVGLLGWIWGGGSGVLSTLQGVASMAWGAGNGLWGAALGAGPLVWLAAQGFLEIVAALWYLVYMLGAIVFMGVWSLLSMIFGGRSN